MSVLEYANRTVPDVVAKSKVAFWNRDPLFDKIRKANRVKRSGGTHVRMIRVMAKHSNISKIDGSNLSVDLSKIASTSTMTGDWGKLVKPIVLPHVDLDRMSSNDERKRYIQDQVDAAMLSFLNDTQQQVYIGNVSEADVIGSLNGFKTTLAASGFESGAIQFAAPGSQTGSYLNETRNYDTVGFVDNWYNQFAEHSGLATALKEIRKVKMRADTFAREGEINTGILGIDDAADLYDGILSFGNAGGQSAVVYTAADLEAGKVQNSSIRAAGIDFHGTRWLTDDNTTGGGNEFGAITGEPVYLLNPMEVEWWVNAGKDFKVSKFTNFLETMGEDADVAFIELEAQFAIPNLMANGGVANL